MSDNEESLTVRFPRGVKPKLEKKSAADRRSLNAEIVWLLESILRGDYISKGEAYDLVREAIRSGSGQSGSPGGSGEVLRTHGSTHQPGDDAQSGQENRKTE